MNDDKLPGSKVRDGHRATLFGVLGKDAMVPVRSQGGRFYMEGQFPLRHLLLGSNVDRIAANPAAAADVTDTINRAVAGAVPRITIAETADVITRRNFMALLGGAYHEAFHRLWSQQGSIGRVEVARIVAEGATAGVNYAVHSKLLLTLQNVLEDIRIERIGCAEFPGVVTKLADLADFVIDAEAPVRANDLKVGANTANVALAVLREVGLGYNTVKVGAAMAHYRTVSPSAVAMVLNGPLTPILRAIVPDVSTPAKLALAKLDTSLSTILALKAIAALVEASKQPEQPKQGKQGKQPKQGKQSGEPDSGEPDSGEPEQGEPEQGDADGEPEQGESGDEPDSDADGSDGDSDGDSDSDDADGDSDGDSDSDDADGDADSDDADGDADGDSDGDSDDSDEPSVNDAGDSQGSGGNGSGGGAAADVLRDGGDAKLADYASALETELKADRKEESAKLAPGEKPYRPASTSFDREKPVAVCQNRVSAVAKLAGKVKGETSFLKAKLRTMFRAMEDGSREHGVRRGPVLSERFLVDTLATLREGRDPARAFAQDDVTVDVSIASCVVLDQSGSMYDKIDGTIQVAHALGEALEAIGAKSSMIGFTTNGSGYNVYQSPGAELVDAHRTDGVDIDVFKTFDERFKTAAPKLSAMRATGGTPMADGIEYALRALSARREGYRVIFVLTDGVPDAGHLPVMKSQFRRAAEAGIVIVGVGLGFGADYVTQTFEHSVYAPVIADLPRPLVSKLHELVMGRIGNLRGRKVRAA